MDKRSMTEKCVLGKRCIPYSQFAKFWSNQKVHPERRNKFTGSVVVLMAKIFTWRKQRAS